MMSQILEDKMGTSEGAKKALEKILAKNPNHFKEIGRIGGIKGTTGGFASDKKDENGLTGAERASLAGKRGGAISRRKPNIYVLLDGKRHSLSEVAKIEGISYRTAFARMSAGKYEKI